MSSLSRQLEDSVRDPNGQGSGCLTAFASVFLFAGVVAAGLALWQLADALEARSWQPAEAIVLDATLSRQTGDDSTTYQAQGRFRYQWQGDDYESTRVSFSRGHDNVGDYQRTLYNRLKAHQRSGQPLNVWVNPDRPDEAVVNREPHWGGVGLLATIGLVFALVGAGLIAGARHGARVEAREHERRRTHPGQPWRWRDEWQSPTLSYRGAGEAWLMTGFAVLWNLMSLPILLFLPDELDSGNTAALIGLVFPLIGVGLVASAALKWLRARRYGPTTLTLEPMPLALGGNATVHFRTRSPLPPATVLNVTLSNLRRRRRRSNGKSSTSETVLTQDEQRVRLPTGSSGGGAVQLSLTIPPDGRETSFDDPSDQIVWRLAIAADTDGPDLKAEFELPVFGIADEPAAHPAAAPASIGADPVETGVTRTTTADGYVFTVPALRHAGLAVTLAVMAAVAGVAAGLIWLAGSRVIPIIAGAVAVIFMLSALHTALYRSRITVRNGALTLERGWLTLGRKRTLTDAEVLHLRRDSSLTVGGRRYYDIVADLNDGSRLKLANSLAGNRATDALIDQLAALAGMQRAGG